MKPRHSLVYAAMVLTLAPSVSHASAHDEEDHELAREALEEGRILPLKDILAALDTELPGQIIEVDLDRDAGQFVYEIKVLSPDGRIMEAEIDAETARLIGVEPDDD